MFHFEDYKEEMKIVERDFFSFFTPFSSTSPKKSSNKNLEIITRAMSEHSF